MNGYWPSEDELKHVPTATELEIREAARAIRADLRAEGEPDPWDFSDVFDAHRKRVERGKRGGGRRRSR
jgi:hypothetical protein